MKTGDLVKQFGVSDTTIRRWVAEFEGFLSDDAKKTNSRQRVFNSSDFLVLATIHALSSENLPLSMIQERLAEGYRVEDTASSTVGYSDGRMVPAAAVEQIVDATELRVEIESLKRERDRLLELLDQERNISHDKDQRIDVLQTEIKTLLRELGRAEGRLEQIDRSHKRDEED